MENDVSVNLPVINQDVLSGVVRSVLSNEHIEVESWQIDQIGGGVGNPVSAGIYRVQGVASERSSKTPWSVILKVIQSPENVGEMDMGGGEDPTHWNYWKREPLVYRSGVLNNLPQGLAAPVCYAVEELPGNMAHLWLEEIRDMYNGAWTLQRYSLGSRHLGRLNGMYSTKSSYSEYPWLGKGTNRQWLQMLFSDDLRWDHPLMLRRYPEPDTNPFIQLVLQNERFLGKLDFLPVTLSHGDTYPTNFMSRIDRGGREQTVALDWAFLGLQPLGDDLGQFVFGAISNLNSVSGADIVNTLFEAYVQGLRDEGCNLDVESVRYNFVVSAALRGGLFQLFMLGQEIEQRGVESVPGESNNAPDPFEVVMAREAFRLLKG